ncbi:succinylglutamate desuccinylase/aspartoacylase family protein [Chelatococcus asaccharovorans]|uniref:succinylglutamate desuccinylase/aspartoacylase family protein n=1 Tax=Chelatococcus asaccharovorans TaxID=28210 RepID=UPI00224C7A8F|nr:succinylglutamate desuccinylase/aspartoacylase family protein [Chelatococcus asaccharovorans]CAH1656007.1 putative N-alpha-acetyl-L-2,4-diaminobutyric acid deacetylase [Chelatococcus asaccharovorans]CAH1685245.1 putative N-alpha-acetyl-L-2,4-diaminobutyric acid deacetylase [Chelatococcus asaccharovorans]
MVSPVWTTIDFHKRGVQSDYARVPYSSDTSAYGWIPVPMICFNGGDGPTALLTAGTHGDEYEGQIALRRIARALCQTEVKGRIIILPELNRPAVIAGRRNSPLDGGNLNRLFPGSAVSGPTAMIAEYVTEVLFPLADYVLDLHSGGSSLDYMQVAYAHRGHTPEQDHRIGDLLDCFAAPNSILTDGRGGGGATTLYAAAAAHGVAALTTELGGGQGLSQAGVRLAEDGVRRVLHHFGIVPDLVAPASGPTRKLKILPPETAIYAPADGLFEPLVEVGAPARAGQAAGYLHLLSQPLADPIELRFKADGIVIYRRYPTLTTLGDALYGLAAESEC